MSEELKPCPFCGEPFTIVTPGNLGYMYSHREGGGCVMSSNSESGWNYETEEALADDLNTRPIEAALLARLQSAEAALAAANERVKELEDAEKWRPTIDEPELDEVCFAWCANGGKSTILRVRYNPFDSEDGNWYSIEYGWSTAVLLWRKLPPAPSDK